jgi:hypothetical protein
MYSSLPTVLSQEVNTHKINRVLLESVRRSFDHIDIPILRVLGFLSHRAVNFTEAEHRSRKTVRASAFQQRLGRETLK